MTKCFVGEVAVAAQQRERRQESVSESAERQIQAPCQANPGTTACRPTRSRHFLRHPNGRARRPLHPFLCLDEIKDTRPVRLFTVQTPGLYGLRTKQQQRGQRCAVWQEGAFCVLCGNAMLRAQLARAGKSASNRVQHSASVAANLPRMAVHLGRFSYHVFSSTLNRLFSDWQQRRRSFETEDNPLSPCVQIQESTDKSSNLAQPGPCCSQLEHDSILWPSLDSCSMVSPISTLENQPCVCTQQLSSGLAGSR